MPFLVYGLSPGQEVDGDWQQHYRSIVSSRTSRILPSLFVCRLSLHRTQPCWGHVRVAFEGWPDRARVDGLLVSKAKVFEVIPVPVSRQELLIQSEVVLLSCSADFITFISLQLEIVAISHKVKNSC